MSRETILVADDDVSLRKLGVVSKARPRIDVDNFPVNFHHKRAVPDKRNGKRAIGGFHSVLFERDLFGHGILRGDH